MNDRVSYNLNRAESLLDEPDTGFSLGGGFGASGMGSGIGSGIGGRRETGALGGQASSSNFIAVRSNYTGSDMGDSDTHSNLDSRSRPNWLGANKGSGIGASTGSGLGMGGITEIGTIEVAGGRRSGRFAGGGSSNHSGSMHANRQSSIGPPPKFTA